LVSRAADANRLCMALINVGPSVASKNWLELDAQD
jgi:hypothetical protein